jgi:hypothetical protein
VVTGRLAQGVDCPGVVDVMVGQDHPSEILGLKVAIGHEAEDRLVATGVAGIDHSQPVEPSEQIGLCATNAIDAMNQLDQSIIGRSASRSHPRLTAARRSDSMRCCRRAKVDPIQRAIPADS